MCTSTEANAKILACKVRASTIDVPQNDLIHKENHVNDKNNLPITLKASPALVDHPIMRAQLSAIHTPKMRVQTRGKRPKSKGRECGSILRYLVPRSDPQMSPASKSDADLAIGPIKSSREV